jgi:hypothetical protein
MPRVVTLMKKIFEVADQGIWFIELYMEVLALRMDTGRLPEFPRALGIPVSSAARERA